MAQKTLSAKLTKVLAQYPIGSQENLADPIFVAKLFDIAGGGTWYITEYDPESGNAFTYVTGLFMDEWGYVNVPELEAIKWM